jgi:4-hydroxy-2-oxoheptanedioate aldolase
VRSNTLREVLEAGRVAVCGWISSDSAYAAEVLSHAGYDTVTVDVQHGMFGVDRAVTLLQAVSAGPAMPMARVPSLDPPVIGKLLDAGAYGIICPAVDTAEQATAFVRAMRYPPTGERSYGPSRGLLYGGPDYSERADETVLAWAMVESATALQNLEAILAVPGLDGVYVGPNDLALSLGERPGSVRPPARTWAALVHIAERAAAAGVFAGVFTLDAAVGAELAALGYGLVTPGNDVAILRAAAADRVATVRGTAGQDAPAGY